MNEIRKAWLWNNISTALVIIFGIGFIISLIKIMYNGWNMNINEYREIIRKMVNESTGIKAVELATRVAVAMHEVEERATNYDIWEDGLDPLIESGEIIELEYILPDTDWRIKSIFFPKGTKIEPHIWR